MSWKNKVIYQIYPRSFMDSNGNGKGDLNGIQKTQQLAKKYHVKTVECANKINNLLVRKEMIELADIALKRDK